MGSASCTSNTFSVSVDASGVNTSSIHMTLTHGTQTASIGLVNSRFSLSIDATALLPFTLHNAADYSVTGVCDSTLPTDVVVKLTDNDDDTNSASDDRVTCSNDEYSVSFDGRAITSEEVTVKVTHGSSQSAHVNVPNLIVRLALDALPAAFNLSTASSYTVSGKCDFSLGENVTITLVGTSVDGSPVSSTPACVSGNTFSGDLDASAVTANPPLQFK